jgi:hypothetical protein
MSSNESESNFIAKHKKKFERMTILDLLAKENQLQLKYFQRIPSLSEELILIELHKELYKRLK